jgi:hypothetical protein
MMTSNSPFSLKAAKDAFGDVLIGLGLMLSAYGILNTINPNLVNLHVGLTPITVSSAVSNLGAATYKQITGKDLKSSDAYNADIKAAAEKNKIDYCIVKAIVTQESGAWGADAIGHDENVAGTVSNAALKATTTFGGKDGSGGQNDDEKIDVNSPGLGLDWRFSHGIGLMQVTFFPEGWGIGYAPSDSLKNVVPKRAEVGSYTPKDMVDSDKNIDAGIHILLADIAICKQLGLGLREAFGLYNGGTCGASPAYADRVMGLYTQCLAQPKQ